MAHDHLALERCSKRVSFLPGRWPCEELTAQNYHILSRPGIGTSQYAGKICSGSNVFQETFCVVDESPVEALRTLHTGNGAKKVHRTRAQLHAAVEHHEELRDVTSRVMIAASKQRSSIAAVCTETNNFCGRTVVPLEYLSKELRKWKTEGDDRELILRTVAREVGIRDDDRCGEMITQNLCSRRNDKTDD